MGIGLGKIMSLVLTSVAGLGSGDAARKEVVARNSPEMRKKRAIKAAEYAATVERINKRKADRNAKSNRGCVTTVYGHYIGERE